MLKPHASVSNRQAAVSRWAPLGPMTFIGQRGALALLPLAEDLPSYGEQLMRMLIALGVILLLLLVVAKLLPRWMGHSQAEEQGDGLDVLAIRKVDTKTKVVLVRAGAEHVLFAVTDSGAERLASGPSLDPDFSAGGGTHAGLGMDVEGPRASRGEG